MNIVVCIKQVPETREVEVDEATGVLKREGVDSVINPYDLHALEAAIALKEAHGGTVTVISMGPPQAKSIIREAFMMGADRGVLLSDRAFAGADTLATAYTLAKGIETIGSFDVIICGLQTTDGDTAQVGPGIAELLAIPHEAYVQCVHAFADDKLSVTRDMGDSVEKVQIKAPCLITVTKSCNQPRLLSYRLKLATKDWPIEVLSKQEIATGGAEYFGLKGSPTQVERIFPPQANHTRELWQGDNVELTEKMFSTLQKLKFA